MSDKRLFVLDTNVLMHDPTALLRFHEHDIYLPMMVLEELDAAKQGTSEIARNVRQVSRFLDELIHTHGMEAIATGLPLSPLAVANGHMTPHGRLYFQTETLPMPAHIALPGTLPDNNILGTALALQQGQAEGSVRLVSKDINLRIKAQLLGIRAEDYYHDKVLDDVNLLYRGHEKLPADFFEQVELQSWQERGTTFYRVRGALTTEWRANQCLFIDSEEGLELLVRRVEGEAVVLELLRDHRKPRHAVWGINARNREQNFAFNLLLDPEIDFVTLVGMAGTGKTLLALAAGLMQVLEQNRYREIIITRATVPVGEDIGFLPGTEEEKMMPWMGALMDNLEVLAPSEGAGAWGRAATGDFIHNRIKIRSLNFMRGRTFLNKYLILDEAQNLTPKQMKTLVTRAGPGTKVVCLGNVAQIDTPYLTETTSGLTYVVDRFKGWLHSGHITLQRGERSRLADQASEVL